MSSKTIHICDRCSSYIKKARDLVIVTITIDAHYSYELGYSSYVASKQEKRELCLQCISALKTELNLDLDGEALTDLLFKDFDEEFDSKTNQ